MLKWKHRISYLWMQVTIFCMALACSPWVEAAKKPAKMDNSAQIKEASSSVWAVPYILVILAIILGLVVLCSPVRRDNERRKED